MIECIKNIVSQLGGTIYVELPSNCPQHGIVFIDISNTSNAVWRKCFKGENYDEFDESKLHRQNFPFQYFAVELNNLSTSTCNIYLNQNTPDVKKVAAKN